MRLPAGPFVLCLGLAGCAGGACKAPQEDSEVPLMRLGAEEIAPVLINGEPVGLILDTGAFGTSVTPQAVQDLHLATHTLPLRTAGIGGETFSQATELDQIKVGGAELSGAAAVVIPLSKAGLGTFPAYGLLGQDLLVNWDLDLDAGHDRLTLYEPQQCAAVNPPWTGSAQQVDIPKVLTGAATESTDIAKGFIDTPRLRSAYSGEILFPVTLDGHDLTAMLDSGASASAVRQDAVGLDDAALSGDPARHMAGASLFSVTSHRHQFADLQIGGSDYGPIKLDVGAFQIHGADLLLGEDFLRRHRVYIAFHAGKLFVARGE